MKAAQQVTEWGFNRSPFAWLDTVDLTVLEYDGPVLHLVVRGVRDDGSLGPIGAFWMSEDMIEGGFVPSRSAGWAAGEMSREYDGARARGWSAEGVFQYWSGSRTEHAGISIDAPERADDIAALRTLVA